jgi:hypothetical protein
MGTVCSAPGCRVIAGPELLDAGFRRLAVIDDAQLLEFGIAGTKLTGRMIVHSRTRL